MRNVKIVVAIYNMQKFQKMHNIVEIVEFSQHHSPIYDFPSPPPEQDTISLSFEGEAEPNAPPQPFAYQ